MQEEKCKECNVRWSCKCLKDRFLTKNEKCGYNKINVDTVHSIELQQRKDMLKVVKNYGR